jgi:broad specificity phosphatase PhoE
MLFYFIRHGETIYNREHRMSGSGLDVELTDVGHRQAESLAQSFRQLVRDKIHRLHVSNLVRAQQTAGYLAKTLGLQMQTVPDLREWHLGDWEGQDSAKCVPLMLGIGEPGGDGESRQAFYTRVARGWSAVHNENEPYAMVSHGGVWLAMQDNLKIPRFRIGNCQIVRAEFRSGQWHAEILA